MGVAGPGLLAAQVRTSRRGWFPGGACSTGSGAEGSSRALGSGQEGTRHEGWAKGWEGQGGWVAEAKGRACVVLICTPLTQVMRSPMQETAAELQASNNRLSLQNQELQVRTEVQQCGR